MIMVIQVASNHSRGEFIVFVMFVYNCRICNILSTISTIIMLPLKVKGAKMTPLTVCKKTLNTRGVQETQALPFGSVLLLLLLGKNIQCTWCLPLVVS